MNKNNLERTSILELTAYQKNGYDISQLLLYTHFIPLQPLSIHFWAHKLRNLKLSKIKNPKKFQISVSNFLVEQDIGLRVENLL